MINKSLTEALSRFTELVMGLPDDALEKEWVWGSYESEGIRFAFFRTYEELQELAVKLRGWRYSSNTPLTEAQMVLSQYHAAYMDLQGLLLGVEGEIVDKPPAEGEWSLREVLSHIVGADLGFYVIIKYTLDRHRLGYDPLVEIPDETWLTIAGLDEIEIDSLMGGPMESLQTYHSDLHERILVEFSDISRAELDIPSRYWEKEFLSLRFRLHRFDSHMRQHSIQMEKTLQGVGNIPNESKRLLRLLHGALAEVNGTLFGAPGFGESELEDLSKGIDTRTLEIESILCE